MIPTLVLVEGDSDAAAVRALGVLTGLDLESKPVQIRAVGPETVERVIDAQFELASFRRFQSMPQHRQSPVHQQLRRFLGTRATRKIRSARRLVEALDPARLPHPLAQLAATLRNQ